MTRLLYFSFLLSFSVTAQYQSDSSTFQIFLSPESCKTEPSDTHVYEEEIDQNRGVRIITANGIPTHKTGLFPNSGNPNSIQPQNAHYEIPLEPKRLSEPRSAQGIRMGILFSGVELDPFTGEFFRGKDGFNHEWNITTLTSTVNLGLDCNNGHVQPNGKYHYHGTPNAFLEELNVDSGQMIKVGYAADGYPIYYKFGFDENGEIEELESGYRLMAGNRPGDGKTAPDGDYDGTYFQDYEYVEGDSKLDACNGRYGKTPESDNEYYYVITDNFPSSPICFSAEPSSDFMNGPGGGLAQGPNRGPQGPMGNTGRPNRSGGQPQGQHPNPDQLMEMMDTNHDGRLAKSEVRGPLQNDFDRFDKNNDGYLTKQELEAGPH